MAGPSYAVCKLFDDANARFGVGFVRCRRSSGDTNG